MKKYNKVYMRPSGMNMAEGNGKVWMALLHRNGICEIDIKTREAKLCKIFEEEPLDGEFLYCYVEKIGERLIFSPGLAEKIAIYDLRTETMMYIPLKNADKYRELKFWNIIRYQSDVYFLAYTYPAIIKLNMESMEIEYITDWLNEIIEDIPVDAYNGYFSDGHVMYDDQVLIPVNCMRAVLELNLKTARTKIRKLEVSMRGIGGLSSRDGENIWLVGRGGKANWVSCWNRKTGDIKEIFLKEIGEDMINPFFAPVCTESKVYLMPMSAPYICEIDPNKKKIGKCRLIGTITQPLWEWTTMATRLHEDWLIFITGSDFGWHEYSMETGKSEDYYIYMEENEKEIERYFDTIYSKYKEEKYPVIPEIRVPLEYFLDRVLEMGEQFSDKVSHEILFGKKIYAHTCTDM